MRLGDVTRTMTYVMGVCSLYILCCAGARPPHEMDICVSNVQITEHCLKCGQIVEQADPAESIYKKCCRKSTNFYDGVCRELIESYGKTRAPATTASGSGRETDNSDDKKEPSRW